MECLSAVRALSLHKTVESEEAKEAGAEEDRVAEACWRSLESEEWGDWHMVCELSLIHI